MERINKKIFNIEKTLNKMKKEISSIKSITYNTNTTNSSYNKCINIKNKNSSLNNNKDNCKKMKKLYTLKHYFQLTDKETQNLDNKKKLRNPHSNLIDYSNLINNDEMTNSDNNEEKKAKTIYNIHENDIDKKFYRMSILKQQLNGNNNNNDSFENNFAFQSHNLFFNYNNSKKQNRNKNKFLTNFSKKNKSENKKNNFNNYSLDNRTTISKNRKIFGKKLISKIYNYNYDIIEKTKNKCYDLKNINNNNMKKDNKEENKSNENKINIIKYNKMKLDNKKSNKYNSISNENIGIELFYSNEKENNNNYNYSMEHIPVYKDLINDENEDINCNLNVKQNQKYNEEKNIENLEEKYSQIMDILGDKSVEEINNNAILFDKYGYNGFEKYLNYKKNINNSSISDTRNLYQYLLDYKNYIESLKLNDEYMNEINSYKILCDKLLRATNGHNIQKIEEKINYKLKKNMDNKKLLEKFKNILFELYNNNNIY